MEPSLSSESVGEGGRESVLGSAHSSEVRSPPRSFTIELFKMKYSECHGLPDSLQSVASFWVTPHADWI